MKKNGKRNRDSFLKECKIGLILLLPPILYVFIFGWLTTGCANVEFMYSEAQWLSHKVHFQDGDTLESCAFCRDYEKRIP